MDCIQTCSLITRTVIIMILYKLRTVDTSLDRVLLLCNDFNRFYVLTNTAS